jgi:hypothetical protein
MTMLLATLVLLLLLAAPAPAKEIYIDDLDEGIWSSGPGPEFVLPQWHYPSRVPWPFYSSHAVHDVRAGWLCGPEDEPLLNCGEEYILTSRGLGMTSEYAIDGEDHRATVAFTAVVITAEGTHAAGGGILSGLTCGAWLDPGCHAIGTGNRRLLYTFTTSATPVAEPPTAWLAVPALALIGWRVNWARRRQPSSAE